jgi:hypothetical protein
MNKLTIYRRYFDFGTYSTLELGDETLLVIEPPWIGDGYPSGKPYESCIPEGLYQLSKHNGTKYKDTWAFVNHDLGVYHWPVPEARRHTCVFHAANYPMQLTGCAAPGKTYEASYTGWGVGASRDAMAYLRDYITVKGITHVEFVRHGEEPIPVIEGRYEDLPADNWFQRLLKTVCETITRRA